MSLPGKDGQPLFDLSEDHDVQVDTSGGLTERQVSIERVIKKVLSSQSVETAIADSVRNAFKMKLWRMGKKLSKVGGTKRKRIIEEWKTSTWHLTLDVKSILGQKRKLELSLENEQSKRQKLESKVHALRDLSNKQSKLISVLQNGGRKCRSSCSKSWHQYSRQHQVVKRKMFADKVNSALSMFNDDPHFTPISMQVSLGSGQETLDLSKGTFVKSSHGMESATEPDDFVKFVLYVKDKFSLSDSAYKELTQLVPALPRFHNVKLVSKGLNSTFDIFQAPNGYTGVQQHLKDRLEFCLQNLSLQDDELIQVKLTGDGTIIGRSFHVLNIAFTLINDLSSVSSCDGNHLLAILKCPENYDSLKESLEDILKEASELKSVSINGRTHQIEYFLGGDLKFLALVCGIEAANGSYSCIWCKCRSSERWDMSKEWSAFDVSKGARTVKEIQELSIKSRANMGCKRSPLFTFIPIHRVLIDTLHLFLRVSDLLINLLIQDLRRVDGIAKATAVDPVKHTSVSAYEKFLKDVCKINFKFYCAKESKDLQWRDLTGPEKIRVFKNIDIPKYFPRLKNASALQDIWNEFWRLFSKLEAPGDTEELKADIHNWVKMFLKQYQTKNVTPYVHAFAFHVPEFIEKYNSVTKFNQQGLEKLNDVTTQHYMRSSNHHEQEALMQVMQKRNRLESLEANGFKRAARKNHCSVCGESTHIKRNCPLS